MGVDADFPRTLIVGAHFTEHCGTGTYLGMLFSGWPMDRIATVCEGLLPPDWRRCRRHYRVGNLEHRLSVPFKWLVPTDASGPVLPSSADLPPSTASPPRMSLYRHVARYPWRMLLNILDGGEVLYRVGPSPQLLSWVREFQPDVIYGRCSYRRSVLLLQRIQQASGLPLVLHFMDDWPENLYRDGHISRFLRPRYLAEFAELVRSADAVVAICQEMAEEYEKRYRRPVLSLPMPVELEHYQTTARTEWTAGRPFRLRYGGRVGWAIRESLADLAGTVHGMRQGGTDVAFDLVTFQTGQVPAECFSSSGVHVQAPGPLADLPRLQAEADVLIICYDFDSTSFQQAKFSMPGKLAESMASGTPILVYGPAGLPVVEYARRENWGKVVDRRDPSALQAGVRELMDSAALREQLGRTARRLAIQRHDARAVSEELRGILAASTNRGRTVNKYRE